MLVYVMPVSVTYTSKHVSPAVNSVRGAGIGLEVWSLRVGRSNNCPYACDVNLQQHAAIHLSFGLMYP